MKKLVFASLIIAGSYGFVLAQEKETEHAVMISDDAGWHKIASTTVSFQREREEVIVMGADRFAAIKFEVADAPIDLQSLEVYYESGDRQDIAVNTPIAIGTKSRQIDLNGGERNLKSIIFQYRTLPNTKDEKATVTIWGLKTNVNQPNQALKNDADRDVQRDKAREMNADKNKNTAASKPESSSSAAVVLSDAKGWNMIGARRVDLKRDRDEVLLVGANRFASIKFKVTDASIHLMSAEVYFSKGDRQDLAIHTDLYKGNETKAIDLKGGLERDISKIVLVYKTLPNSKDMKANVEIWGFKTNQVHNIR